MTEICGRGQQGHSWNQVNRSIGQQVTGAATMQVKVEIQTSGSVGTNFRFLLLPVSGREPKLILN